MGITINGSSAAGNIDLGTNGTITDLAVGGLPDGTVDADTLAANAAGTVDIRKDLATLALQTAVDTNRYYGIPSRYMYTSRYRYTIQR